MMLTMLMLMLMGGLVRWRRALRLLQHTLLVEEVTVGVGDARAGGWGVALGSHAVRVVPAVVCKELEWRRGGTASMLGLRAREQVTVVRLLLSERRLRQRGRSCK